MKKTLTVAVSSVAVAGLCWIVFAGDLEPPGPPAPTMGTLQEIYDRLDGLVEVSVLVVPKTGQTLCTTEDGTPIDCAGTGHDGEYQAGVSVDPRFTDNGDGTVRDNVTGLTWLKDANCFGLRNWALGLSDANTLADGSCGLTDGSLPGEWRMPNVKESQSLIDYGHFLPALPDGHPFSGVQTTFYWSSTSISASETAGQGHAWYMHFGGGYMGLQPKTEPFYVWPVRGGL